MSVPDHQLYSQFPNLFSGLGFLDELAQSHQNDDQQNQCNSGSGNSHQSDGLTVDEQRVYDRQIRIWGLETQNLMRKSRVLFVGDLNGLGSELCKNLTLAGIGSLTICDNTITTPESFQNNFLLSERFLANDFDGPSGGKNYGHGITVGQASLEGLQALNPNVHIDHVLKPQSDLSLLLTEIDLQTYTIVICCGIDMRDAVYLNHQCRLITETARLQTIEQSQIDPSLTVPNPLFVYTDMCANFGIAFYDFNRQHNYFVPEKGAATFRTKAQKMTQNDKKKGNNYLARAVSLGTSLSRIGIPIDALMAERLDTWKSNGVHSTANSIQLDQLDEATLTTLLKSSSNLYGDNVTYTSDSYIAQTLQNGKDTPITTTNTTELNGRYQKRDESAAQALRLAKRAVKHAHIMNYFLSGYRCPAVDSNNPGLYPIQLLTNIRTLKNDQNCPITNDHIELTGYAAVLGGVVTQEIIKSFQHESQMAVDHNWLHLDMASNAGEGQVAHIL